MRERVGPAGEAAAVAHLRERGFEILAVDWRCRLGQADIVALHGDVVVLVEVKARRSAAFGLPQEAVDARKQRKLRALLEAYRLHSGRQQQPCRIDVVALLLDGALGVRRCEHIIDAVSGDG
ncbi:MAG: YraN family protein [Candidatus Dormibacteria bacterium]